MSIRGNSLTDLGYPTVCNVTRYDAWKSVLYTGPLLHIATFWIYQTQPQITLSQELALALALDKCKMSFHNLYDFKAGRNGPIDYQHSFKAMCTLPCLESDNLIQSVMAYTGCTCLQLSTQSGDSLYTTEGDLCQQNTARLLCDLIGYCGIWDCRIGDFMCPRYEYDKREIPLKGKYGNCDKVAKSSARSLYSYPSTVTIIAVIMTATLLFM